MRKIKEVLRLKASGMSNRKIARSCVISRPTVGEYLKRASRADVAWPLPEELGDTALEHQLFPDPPTPAQRDQALPDWLYIQKEFKRKNVTLCSGLIEPDTLIRDNIYQLLRCENGTETNIQTIY